MIVRFKSVATGELTSVTLPNKITDKELNTMFGEGNWEKSEGTNDELISENKMDKLYLRGDDRKAYLTLINEGIVWRSKMQNFLESRKVVYNYEGLPSDITVACGIYISNCDRPGEVVIAKIKKARKS